MKKLELLAPGGDLNSIKAAIAAGTDAVYCGLNKFNARNRASNISFEELSGAIRLAHKNNCRVFLTLNVLFTGNEIPELFKILNKLADTDIDAIIVQDIGLLYLLKKYFPDFTVHASTQLTTHNNGQIEFLNKLNVSRVNLSRELNINEIGELTATANKNNTDTEIFIHGSYCISFSGLCYMSSVHGAKSGNRGKCSQPCRDRYLRTPVGKDYPLNLKDNSAFFDIKEIAKAGVSSLKIEGRIKEYDYVYTAVKRFKEQLKSIINENKLIKDNSILYKVFNRDFSNAYLKGNINKDMFIDNPRDNSIKHLSDISEYKNDTDLEKAHLKFYEEKDRSKADIKKIIDKLSIDRTPLKIVVSGELNTKLKVEVITENEKQAYFSYTKLQNKGQQALNKKVLFSKLKSLNNSEYYIKEFDIENLQSKLYVPFKEISSIKNKISFQLKKSKEFVKPLDVPFLKKEQRSITNPKLSVLISSKKEIDLIKKTEAYIYFEIPSGFSEKYTEFLNLFKNNEKFIPWFSSVIIGDDYTTTVKFLNDIKPKMIVTNNTGIAYEACKNKIKWIAGPFLNITNSFSLLCLKEKINCGGSFLSNEISRQQIKSIIPPSDFDLHYSIYHPIELMTSRQCFFHQITGCEKDRMGDSCLSSCERSASITNLKDQELNIIKTKGNYNKIYNNQNYLNTDIINDFPNTFSNFLIDLRDIKTQTKIEIDKKELIKLFNNYISGDQKAKSNLKEVIHNTTNSQYIKRI